MMPSPASAMTAVPASPSVTASGTPASMSATKTPKRIQSRLGSPQPPDDDQRDEREPHGIEPLRNAERRRRHVEPIIVPRHARAVPGEQREHEHAGSPRKQSEPRLCARVQTV